MKTHAALALSTLALTGCNKISGKIGGDRAELKDAFFIQAEDIYGDSGDGQIVVYAASFADTCDIMTAYNEDLLGTRKAEEMENLWEEYFPEEFWEVILVLRVNDPSDSKETRKTDFKGVDWDDLVGDDDEVEGYVTHYQEHLTAAHFVGETEADVDSWYTDEGELKLNKFKSEEKIDGKFSTEVVEVDDGDDEGEITIHFAGRYCEDMADLAYEYDEEQTGSGDGGDVSGGGGASE